jgi:hypothetical protein
MGEDGVGAPLDLPGQEATAFSDDNRGGLHEDSCLLVCGSEANRKPRPGRFAEQGLR